ncbi:tegument protein UL24 [Aotine betaherpesvirus 1]|uniref:Tegument protein UL24 n=1 Tax=Aotine betaherpesvirus 1 TaxID=50290 RepID=G8XU99_9BETA|nr:tegument protein UL24 [Aotine betaherpesvirus 1]AEV80730.1 tegument protein UL24 [Aotine betaherpesvirus 1]
MQTLAVAMQIGPGCLAAYMRMHEGRQVALRWPPDWSLVLSDLADDPEYGPRDVRRWNEYLCCKMESLQFMGRAGRLSTSGGFVGETLVLLISEEGRVFCYGGPQDDAVYYVAEDLIDFSQIGLHHVERLHRPQYLRNGYVKQEFESFIRAWAMGFDALARFIVRNQGRHLPMSYPYQSEMRLCSLRCFEASAFSGTMMRLARAYFGSRMIGLGTVDIQRKSCRRRSKSVYYDWPKCVIPIFMIDDGRIFACDLLRADYVRLADNVSMFMCLGLTRYYSNRRFGGQKMGCHDRVADCPKDLKHVVSA